MRTSIATVCLSGTLEEKLHACAEAGFDGVEIFELDLVVSPHSPERIRDLARHLGLTLDLYQPIRDLEGVDEALFAQNLRRAEAKFRLMNRLGIDLALICSNVATATVNDDAVVADQLRRLGDLAARYGVRLAYEALAWGKYVNDFEHSYRLVQAADHASVGVALDSFHILSRDWPVEPIERLDPEKIFFVQLADAPRMQLDVLSWSRHYRVFPGEGGFDLAGFMAHLLRTGYDGPVSLEIFNDTFRQADPFRTAIDGLRSLIWLQEQARERLASEQRGEGNVRLATLPAVDEPSGFNFAELKGTEPTRLRQMLDQLGFADSGRHRSKPAVELWSQGDARVIINAQRGAEGRLQVAGIGFDVVEPLASCSRALQLHATSVQRTQQLGEEVLQVVSAPDGTEISFARLDDQGRPPWMVEFEHTVPNDGLITGIDHINLAQPWQHFDEAVLFFESVLGLRAQPSLDITAPMGLVRSQVVSSEDRAVRLALNLAPLGRGDHHGRFHEQHIAFACTDVRALARQAVANGLKQLRIPDNYYDDLQSRFDLDEAFLGELRALNLLYDRDEHGDFLHFYTEAIDDVFLEVVERRSGYDGYGAPNAPVRLAAQYRV
ncbi:bifunctional sugar phosphate isomerase/epimerase/4-hydroxyphenylpyruvate dioxygenase family protein [Ruicaihuangia caeni]|uniref:3-dehydroshikimate dehydratase n=1 Tax=Ruicaihuangia caeni TaxID=3042517 RepID=A0AAW6TBF7_9MICO|nr:sugar phosphate isomerase/epimerase and 4-hydroxyphenylpyruvate domain-containing protein [Klugiella sp. YN-L-19]MDI2098417.1 TIM barrel protein [Klugiella sp. YN-L-19]